MGTFTKSFGALAAAAVLGFSGAAQAQAANPQATPAPVDTAQEMFRILVEEIALAQTRHSPEVRANPTDENGMRVFRNIFVNEARLHGENVQKLKEQGEQIMRTGFKTREECAVALQAYDSFVLRENVLRNYDGHVRSGRYPGPELRAAPVRIEAATALNGYLRIAETACRRVPMPVAGN